MFNKIKYIGYGAAIVLFSFLGAIQFSNAVTICYPQNGCTGISTSTAANNGFNLYQVGVDANNHPIYSFQANGSGGSASGTINNATSGYVAIYSGQAAISGYSGLQFLSSTNVGTILGRFFVGSSTDSGSTADLVIGTGANTSNFIGVSGGRAMYGFDAANNALVIGSGLNKGLDVYVNGTNNSFLSGTKVISVASTSANINITTTTILSGFTLANTKSCTGSSTAIMTNSAGLVICGGLSSGGGTPASPLGGIQYNDNGTFTASSTFVFSTSTLILNFYGLSSSTQLTTPSGTIGTLTFTSASGTNETITNLQVPTLITFGSEVGTNVSSTNLAITGTTSCNGSSTVLSTDAQGRIICEGIVNAVTGPASPQQGLQYNDGNAFTASSSLIFQTSTVTLNLFGIVSSTQLRVASGTITTLKLTNVSSTNIADTNLTSQNCVGTDAQGQLIAGTCGAGGGVGTSTLGSYKTGNVTLSQSTSTITSFDNLNFATSTGIFLQNATSVVQGTLTVGTSTQAGNPLINVVNASSVSVIYTTSTTNTDLVIGAANTSGTISWSVASSGIMSFLGTSTVSLGGSSLTAGTCTSTATVVPLKLSTTTDIIDVSPQNFPGAGAYWGGYIDTAISNTTSSVTVEVCEPVTATPTATKYLFSIQRIVGL